MTCSTSAWKLWVAGLLATAHKEAHIITASQQRKGASLMLMLRLPCSHGTERLECSQGCWDTLPRCEHTLVVPLVSLCTCSGWRCRACLILVSAVKRHVDPFDEHSHRLSQWGPSNASVSAGGLEERGSPKARNTSRQEGSENATGVGPASCRCMVRNGQGYRSSVKVKATGGVD
jgi:hypothetical protein